MNPLIYLYLGDLWGPLLVCLTLSIMLSITAPSDQSAMVFTGVFVIIWLGAAIVTINAQLLGSPISFFQSVCVLGYCVFPLNIATLACLFLHLFTSSATFVFIRLILVGIGFIWATRGQYGLVDSHPAIVEHELTFDIDSVGCVYGTVDSRKTKSLSCVSCALILFVHCLDDRNSVILKHNHYMALVSLFDSSKYCYHSTLIWLSRRHTS